MFANFHVPVVRQNASVDIALRCNTFITVMQAAGLRDLDYRKPFDLIAEFEQAGKTAKSKTQHSNRDGDRGPAHSEGRKPTEHEGVAPLQIVAGGKSLAGQTGQNEIWLLR